MGVWLRGGAIINGGSVVVTDSSFFYNHAVRGGAIQTWGGVILILGSTFAYNSADIVPTKTRRAGGGAIELYAADQDFPRGDILNSTFIGNSARQGGGAIDNSGAVTVTNSTFTGNVAELQGGAIRNLEGATGTVTLRYTILVNNVPVA
ncbi:MAG: hypothetical protein IPK16_25930 [Anaerolineales bacterium]|nr:hypothetical protein [Anaerolineales bacterium]